jgi:hypothetical protein
MRILAISGAAGIPDSIGASPVLTYNFICMGEGARAT